MMRVNRLTIRICVAVCLFLGIGAGCTKTKEIPPADVKVVEAFDIRLDEEASPREVAFVLLRSLKEDIEAARAHEHEKQEKAVERTFSLAAYDDIERRILGIRNLGQKTPKQSLGDDRDEQIFEIVNRWAPIVSYYVDSFPGDLASAKARMRTLEDKSGEIVHVYLDVEHDPAEKDPAKEEAATLDVEIVKQSAGSKAFWRVGRIGYLGVKEREALSATIGPAATGSSPA